MSYNHWSEYRRRNRIALSFLFGGFLFLGPVLMLLRGIVPEFLGSMLMLVWFFGSVATGYWAAGFRCPRCGEYFFQGNFYRNSFARRCVHCRLPKWEET